MAYEESERLQMAARATGEALQKDTLKNGCQMKSPHISVERAVAFLLHDQKLTPEEEEHVFRCDECRRMMVEAAATDPDLPPHDEQD